MVCLDTCRKLNVIVMQRFDPNNEIVFGGQYEIINETAHIYDAKIIFTKIHNQSFGLYTFEVTNHGGRLIHQINFTQTGGYENPLDQSELIFH